jgi:hypothetical protein
VAVRVEEEGALPEVGVEGRLGGGKRRRGVDEGLLVREAVVRHVVEGMRGELLRELVGAVEGAGGVGWRVGDVKGTPSPADYQAGQTIG